MNIRSARPASPKVRSLGVYVAALRAAKKGDEKILASLKQMTYMHRNPLIHPETVLTADEAIAICGIARSAITAMLNALPIVPPTTATVSAQSPATSAAGVAMYAVSVVADAQTAAILIAVSAFFWGSALPPLFALSLQILPPRAVASGVGVFNGIGNIIGALSPLVMGALISHTGSFNAGLMVLVGSAIVGSFAMVPLIKRF